jgi:transcriptional regulator with XRE-family HTH domain
VDDSREGGAERVLNLNQVVAANVAWYRLAAGMTQKELGAMLGQSAQSISEIERSAHGGKPRKFDAAELAAFAMALGVPLIALVLPLDEDEGSPVSYAAGSLTLGAADMLILLAMPDSDDNTPVLQAYRERFGAAAARWLDPAWAATVAKWLREGMPEDARADQAARLRDWADRQRASASDLDKLAAAIEEDLS